MSPIQQTLFAKIDRKRERLIDLLQQFVQIPSPTFHEGELAACVADHLRTLEMEVFINEIGDVTGIREGSKFSPLLLLNTHLDQADPGDMRDPFSGIVMPGNRFGVEGEVVYGRGTNGQKASLAAMIIAAETLLETGTRLEKGFAINAGVMEECGGHLSPEFLIEHEHLPIFAVLCGEHTDLRVVNRQRGMIHFPLRINGKGAHAAAPEGASSALAAIAKVISGLEQLNERLNTDETLGTALVSINKLLVIPNVANVIPEACEAVVDLRQPASMSRDEITGIVLDEINHIVTSRPGLSHTAGIEKASARTYTGLDVEFDGCMHPFFTPAGDPLIVAIRQSVQAVCGSDTEPQLWTISSEAGYFSTVAGLPVAAFGPGKDEYTHNSQEHVAVEDVVKAAKVYADVVLRLCGRR